MIDELLTASAFPHPVTHLIRRETPISWVILTGRFAYKIKKAVRLDFIDCTELSTRKRMCEQESILNRRLAPELYLGVVAITREADGIRVGGSGAGKSWMSERLTVSLQAVRIRSDIERKRLAGNPAAARCGAPPLQGIYDPDLSARTYARLLSGAAGALQGGIDIIIDAAFLGAADRQMFLGLAERLRVPCLIVSCRADRATLARRIEGRQAMAGEPSDADLDILAWQIGNADPLTPAEQTRSVAVDTDDPNAVAAALAQIARDMGWGAAAAR